MSDNNNKIEINKQGIVYSPRKLREKLHRRLENNSSDLTSRLIQKSRNSFDLNSVEIEIGTSSTINVLVYPTDPFDSDPEEMLMDARDIRFGLSNSNFRVQDSTTANASPNDEGNYIYGAKTPEFDQINSFFYAVRTLRTLEKYILHQINWGFEGKRLIINPHAGIDANAFYSEQEQNISFFSFDVNGKTIHTSQSPDVVCHEIGHAILDGIRDLYNESFGLASGGFHESFGDISAMLVTLQNRTLVNRLLEWTKGNLRQDNLVSKLAEQLGTGLHTTDRDPRNDKIFYLRNAFNNFVNVPYDQLDFVPDNDITTLGSESHSYSRLFTGAFYDVLIKIYEEKSNELGQHGALSYACDLAGRIMIRRIEIGPIGEHSYNDLAKAMLDADKIYFNGNNKDILVDEFSERKIFTRQEAASHLELSQNVPNILLPSSISSPDFALEFINSNRNSLGLSSDIELIPLNGYVNTIGFTFLNYFQTQNIILDGERLGRYNGSSLDVFGGVSLLFDKTKKLTNVTIRMVADEDIRQIKKQIEFMINAGQIEAMTTSSLPLFNKMTRKSIVSRKGKNVPIISPVLGISARNDDGELKLIRHPIHVDVIDPSARGIKEFAQIWKNVYGAK